MASEKLATPWLDESVVHFKNILVATDTRLSDHPIVDEAAKIAETEDAMVKIVDVVPEFPWIVRLALQDHESIHETMVREKKEQLEALAQPLRQRGICVNTDVLIGKTSVEIIRQVLRGKHDLVIRVAKGNHSKREGFFGATGIRLLRDCPCAVWLSTPDPSPEYKHVMACVDTSSAEPVDAELNTKVYEAAQFVSRQHQSRFSVAHASTVVGEEFLFLNSRMENFEKLKRDVRERNKALLDKFLQTQGSSAGDRNVHLLNGGANKMIPAFAHENGVDLIVMGTVARGSAFGLVMGNTAERILDQIACSVLAVKPDSFVSPITLPDTANVESPA